MNFGQRFDRLIVLIDRKIGPFELGHRVSNRRTHTCFDTRRSPRRSCNPLVTARQCVPNQTGRIVRQSPIDLCGRTCMLQKSDWNKAVIDF